MERAFPADSAMLLETSFDDSAGQVPSAAGRRVNDSDDNDDGSVTGGVKVVDPSWPIKNYEALCTRSGS